MATSRTRTKDNTVDNVTDATVAAPENQQMEVRRAIDEVAPELMNNSDFDRAALKSAETFEDFVKLTEQEYGEIVDAAQELGDGFTVLTRKQKSSMLVDVPCLLMSWTFRQGDYERPFVSVRVVARHANGIGKYIVNDGSVGIADQLATYQKETGKTGGMFARGGFSLSEYDTTDKDGNTIPASTVYINTSTLA